MFALGFHTQRTDLTAAYAPTVPARATHVVVGVNTADARITFDGTTPTATKGFRVGYGSGPLVFPCVGGGSVKMIEEDSGATVDLQFIEQYVEALWRHRTTPALPSVRTIGVPAAANYALLGASGETVRVTLDGTNPTATKGFRVREAIAPWLAPVEPSGTVKVIQEASEATLDYAFVFHDTDYAIRSGSYTSINYRAGSFRATLAVNGRGTASFAVDVDPGGEPFDPGDPVYVYNRDGRKIFGGTITRRTDRDLTEGGVTKIRIEYLAVDFDEIAGRKLVAESFESQTAGAIMESIRSDYLAAEGVVAGTIEDGPTIPPVVYPYRSAREIFDELAELSGFSWWIDAELRLQFREREALTAPWSITATSRPYSNLRVNRSREGYRNAQYLRGGTDLAASAAETFAGDGETRTFVTSLPVGAEPTIEVDTGSGYVTKTVGVYQVDTGKDFYYRLGSNEVTQDSGGTVLASAHTLRVTYEGQYPILVRADDTDEQDTRAAAAGFGTGRYEAIESVPDINDEDLALDRALALLRRNGTIPTTLEFDTVKGGLEAGRLLPVTLPDHSIASDFLLESVTLSDRGDGRFRYSVRAVGGEAFGTWTQYFRKLREATRDTTARENEVLLLLRSPSESITLTESVTADLVDGDETVGGTNAYVGLCAIG